MTKKKLFELSGIANNPNFSEMDYAVPMNADGSYPYDGQAYTIYWKDGSATIESCMWVARKILLGQVRRDISQRDVFELLRIADVRAGIIHQTWTEAFA